MEKASRRAAYMTGYTECARETVQFLERTKSISNNTLQELNSYLNRACDSRASQRQVTVQSMSRRVSSPLLMFTSTPLSARDPQMSSVSYHRDNSFVRESASPILEQKSLVFPVETMTSFYASRAGTCSSGDSVNSSRSASPMSVLSSGDDSANMSTVSDSVNSGNDVILDMIVKEEQVWRPW